MSIHIVRGDIHLLDLHLRMPFKYGIATMTHCPHAFVRLSVAVDGHEQVGIAADHLPPKWFTKDPDRDANEEVDEMANVIERAVRFAENVRADSAFDAWLEVHAKQSQWGKDEGLPPLLTQFGSSLVERALIDVVCRQRKTTFARILHEDAFGLRLEAISSELEGKPSDWLEDVRPIGLVARHTVGLADPLTEGELTDANRLDDGLPQSLEACIRTYGLRHFKIKVTGDLERDRDRVSRIAPLLGAMDPTEYGFSFDGNEQFRSADAFRSYWEQLTADPSLSDFFEHLLFVEQPFHRDIALSEDAVGSLRTWSGRPTLIIDESDATLTSLAEALELGYAGTSHKNCKGVFKSMANACLISKRNNARMSAERNAKEESQHFLLSGEDLANIGPVALLQDLAVCAALGIMSVERNGHHYFAGLSMFPEGVQQQMLEHHGDLYRTSPQGWAALDIQGGDVRIGSLLQAPFGVTPLIDVTAFPTLEAWRRKRSQSTTGETTS